MAAIGRTPHSAFPEPRQTSHSGAVGQGPTPPSSERVRAFYDFVTYLHAGKHASYGDSWKKRGEKLSILANMARKVDRLGVGDEFDSSSDTVVDLLVYAIKYGCWLAFEDDGPDNVNSALGYYLDETKQVIMDEQSRVVRIATIRADFDDYADHVDELNIEQRVKFVTELILRLAPIARDLWLAENHDGDDYRGADASG